VPNGDVRVVRNLSRSGSLASITAVRRPGARGDDLLQEVGRQAHGETDITRSLW
jgi:hypothetical protein